MDNSSSSGTNNNTGIKAMVKVDDIVQTFKENRVEEKDIKFFQQKLYEDTIAKANLSGKEEEEEEDNEVADETVAKQMEFFNNLQQRFKNRAEPKQKQVRSVGGILVDKKMSDMVIYAGIGLIGAYGLYKLFSLYSLPAVVPAITQDVSQLLNQ